MSTLSASTTGKSTLLDILWWTRKSRKVLSGTVLVNGREVDDEIFKKVVGYVDQGDSLMNTLTVYETGLYSALLRLSLETDDDARKFRLGFSGHRSIYGGEKRRVSIARGLVTCPSIIFLGELTCISIH
ncbi:hypothetical protein BDN70DRAFT_819818 [Pholiota conissans]|uniref:ABC transporter domain-containing protein n=1 Tax=Pholiota conissans TaxID=109636 RepID=A0A9P5YKP0_9AGAR|nr:hypothetical protein BDN70DRAFT_819818 [Pholiota conissans]